LKLGLLTSREWRRLREFENRVLKKIFTPQKKYQETGEDCITRTFMICNTQQM
jgi:hypothetical protein